MPTQMDSWHEQVFRCLLLLRDLTIVPAAGFKSTTFKKKTPVEILRVGDLNVRKLRDMSASIGNTCEDLCMSRLSTELEGYDSPNIPSRVRRLELEYVDMDCALLPSGLESLEWGEMNTSSYSVILNRLCDPKFLPCLRHFSILTYLTDENEFNQDDAAEEEEEANGGEDDVDAHAHDLHDASQLATVLVNYQLPLRGPLRACAALERRGLPRPSVDEEIDNGSCFYVLECYFRAMNEK